MNFENDRSQPDVADAIRRLVFTGQRSARTFYAEESDGKLYLAGKRNPQAGDVFGWYTLPYTNAPCDYQAWALAALRAARADHKTMLGYDNYVIFFPYTPACHRAFAAFTAPFVFVNGTMYLDDDDGRMFAHEFGHNYGLGHANLLRCISQTGQPVSVSSDCGNIEYGDPFDVQGENFHHHNALSKATIGALPAQNITHVDRPGRYTLAPSNRPSPTGAKQLLVVPAGTDDLRRHVYHYYVEYRQRFGIFDDFQDGAPVTRGVSIRSAPNYRRVIKPDTFTDTLLLDATPETPFLFDRADDGDLDDAPLPAGRSFTDRARGLCITTEGVSELAATVTVDFGDHCDYQPPTRPGDLAARPADAHHVELTWTPSVDDERLCCYAVFRNRGHVTATTGTSQTVQRIRPDTDGTTYGVVAYDAAGNPSDWAEVVF